ncbi:UNVERIFIED_CONTAM: hypothetical protein FKN15_066586 [Acipenser sinensis]
METEIHVPVGSPVIRKLPICVDEHNVIPGALKLIKKLRPAWDTDRVQTKLFTDGITNKLVGCYLEECPADTVLVRVYGNKTELFVDRDNELKSFQVLHANGCAPHLYCTFQNGLCYEFMQGDAMGPQHVRDPVLFRLIAVEMARIHTIHAHNGCIPKPNLWIKLRKYFSLVTTEGSVRCPLHSAQFSPLSPSHCPVQSAVPFTLPSSVRCPLHTARFSPLSPSLCPVQSAVPFTLPSSVRCPLHTAQFSPLSPSHCPVQSAVPFTLPCSVCCPLRPLSPSLCPVQSAVPFTLPGSVRCPLHSAQFSPLSPSHCPVQSAVPFTLPSSAHCPLHR